MSRKKSTTTTDLGSGPQETSLNARHDIMFPDSAVFWSCIVFAMTSTLTWVKRQAYNDILLLRLFFASLYLLIAERDDCNLEIGINAMDNRIRHVIANLENSLN